METALHQKSSFVSRAGKSQSPVLSVFGAADSLQLMGDAAVDCAEQYAGKSAVLVKADSIEFHRVADSARHHLIDARVVFCGHSSMTVLVDVYGTGEAAIRSSLISSGRFMLLAINDQGQPIPLTHPDQHNTKDVNS